MDLVFEGLFIVGAAVSVLALIAVGICSTYDLYRRR